MIEHADLWARRDTDPAAREALIRRYAVLVPCLRERYFRHLPYTLEIGDLESVGYEALVLAVDRFEPQRGRRFTTLACRYILGYMRNRLRADRRHCRDWFPLGVRVNDTLLDEALPSTLPGPEDHAVAACDVDLLWTRIVGLRHDRACVAALYALDWDRHEIAERLGVTPAEIQNLRAAGLWRLRRAYQEAPR